MNRRAFLASPALAALALTLERKPSVPTLWGDGIHDDTYALNEWGAGRPVRWPDGTDVGRWISGRRFSLADSVYVTRDDASRCGITGCHFMLARRSTSYTDLRIRKTS